MKKINQFLSVFLTLALCVGIVTPAFAAEDSSLEKEVTTSDGETVTVMVTQNATTTTTEDGSTTTTTWNGSSTDTTTEVGVNGSETVTTTTGTDTEGNESSTTTTVGEETITETKPAETTIETEPTTSSGIDPEDVVWSTEGGTDSDGWVDEQPSTPSEGGEPAETPGGSEPTEGDESQETPPADSSYDVPLKVDSKIKVTLTQDDKGNFSGSGTVATLDWDEFKGQLSETSGLTQEDLQGLTQGSGNKVEKDGTAVEVVRDEDGKFQVVITKTKEGNVNLADDVNFSEGETGSQTTKTPVTLTEADIPEGCTPVYAEAEGDSNVIIGYKKTVTNDDGSTTTTVTKFETVTTVTTTQGTGTVTQERIVETTVIDLSNTDVDVTVSGNLGEFTREDPRESSQQYGTEKPSQSDNVTIDNVTVSDSKLNAIAEYGYWSAQEGAGSLAHVREASNINELTTEEAKAATQAALFEQDSSRLTGNALAFYNYLIGKVSAENSGSETISMPETETPEISTVTSATVNINDDMQTAGVSFVVSLAPSVTGDLLVTINTENGEEQTERVALDEDNGTVQKNDDGTYTVTLTNVQLGGETVNLTITTKEIVTEREVYKVTTTVPGERVTHEDLSLTNVDKAGNGTSNIQVGNKYDDFRDPAGNAIEVSYSFTATNDGSTKEEKGNSNGITIHYKEGDKKAEVTAPEDKDVEVMYIAVKAANGYVYYKVPDGVLHAGQTISVESVEKTVGNGEGLHAISHVCLIGVGQQKDPETTGDTVTNDYGMLETTTTNTQNATLTLNLSVSVPTATMTQGSNTETRTGTADMTRTDTLVQNQIVTEKTWNSTTTTDPVDPGDDDDTGGGTTPTPPGDDDDDDNDKPPVTPPVGDDDDDTPEVIIPEEDPPLAENPSEVEVPEENPPLVENPPEVEIPEENPPLAEIPSEVEIPEENVPKADAPKQDASLVEISEEEVPLADVPKTGDISLIWCAAAALSASGLAALTLKKREDEEA